MQSGISGKPEITPPSPPNLDLTPHPSIRRPPYGPANPPLHPNPTRPPRNYRKRICRPNLNHRLHNLILRIRPPKPRPAPPSKCRPLHLPPLLPHIHSPRLPSRRNLRPELGSRPPKNAIRVFPSPALAGSGIGIVW